MRDYTFWFCEFICWSLMLENKVHCKAWIWNCSIYLSWLYGYPSPKPFLPMFGESPLSPFWILLGGWDDPLQKLKMPSPYSSWASLQFRIPEKCFGCSATRRSEAAVMIMPPEFGASCACVAVLSSRVNSVFPRPVVWHVLYFAPGCLSFNRTTILQCTTYMAGFEPGSSVTLVSLRRTLSFN